MYQTGRPREPAPQPPWGRTGPGRAWVHRGGDRMDYDLLIAGFFGLVLLYVLLRLLYTPLKYLLLVAGNAIVGAALIWVFNMAGATWQLHVAVNPVTAACVGLLGLPGLAAFALIERFVY